MPQMIKYHIFSLLVQKSILERLDSGEVIVGDGGYCTALEKRCYVKPGPFTPECVVQHPDAGRFLNFLPYIFGAELW